MHVQVVPLDENDKDETTTLRRTYWTYTIYVEVLLVAVVSLAIYVTFALIDDQAIPALPTMQDNLKGASHAQGPSLLDWTQILKRPPRQDASAAFAWHFTLSDVKKNSTEFRRLSETAQRALTLYVEPVHPGLALGWAPQDVALVVHLEQVFYIPTKVRTCKSAPIVQRYEY